MEIIVCCSSRWQTKFRVFWNFWFLRCIFLRYSVTMRTIFAHQKHWRLTQTSPILPQPIQTLVRTIFWVEGFAGVLILGNASSDPDGLCILLLFSKLFFSLRIWALARGEIIEELLIILLSRTYLGRGHRFWQQYLNYRINTQSTKHIKSSQQEIFHSVESLCALSLATAFGKLDTMLAAFVGRISHHPAVPTVSY